jgi:hypothetical protein
MSQSHTDNSNSQTHDEVDLKLTSSQASHFAQLVLKSIHREYPNLLAHLMTDSSQAQTPKSLHPAFYGCFDWHSSVHGHWLLARLLKLFPSLPEAEAIREALGANLTAENIEIEAAYFAVPGRQSYERTYGWAWLLKLDEELGLSTDASASRWRGNLKPLTDVIITRYLDFLPKQNYPIRTGVHPNTAFGLSFALDYARAVSNGELENLVIERSRAYYLNDCSYPAEWEPGGEDFFSPALIEADLIRRVLPASEFPVWFALFLPDIADRQPGLLNPVEVLDRTDPKLVHLDGLNLSRAWCMQRIAAALPEGDPARSALLASARLHALAGLPHVASGDYLGEHWLATFAVYMMTSG